MLSEEPNTVFAAKGSRNILNSAYSLEGIVNTFPLSLSLLLIWPPTIYTSCNEHWPHWILPLPGICTLFFLSGAKT